MAQIIKHRRGQLTGVKSLTSRNAEFIIASGSISDLNGPFVFIGSPNSTDEGVAGAFKSVSKMYEGTTAPTITAGTYGSILDGTPFYASGNESLYILNNDGAGGNTRLDLTGNIEGNLISGVTINNLTGTTANIKNISGSFTGSGIGLYDIPASGITGLELNRISSGLATASISEANGLRVNVNTEITGALNVSGNITGSNLYLSGDAKIDGNITLGGNITVGDATTDFVTFGAEISSSIVPDVHNAFDLGSSSKNWRNLHVSGTAYVDTLEARQVNFTDLGVLEDLTVSGSTFLGNGDDTLIVSGAIYNDQLTEKRLVVAGVDGLLTNYSGLTFDNGNLNLSGALEVTNIQGTGSLFLTPDLNDSRYFEIYNSAPSDIHFKGNSILSFFGDDTNYLKIDDSLQTVTIESTNGLFIDTEIVASSTSELQGAVTINSTLDVTGSAQFKDNVGIAGTLGVTGSAVLKDTLQVDSTSELKGAVGINSTLDVTGSAILKSTLQVNSTSELQGAVGMNSTLDVTGSAQFKDTINVDGIATISSAIVEDLTQGRIVTVGLGGALIDSSGFTYNGTVLQIGDGQFEVDTNDGDIRTSGSLTTDNIYSTVNNDNSLHLNGGSLGAPDVELESSGQISLFSEGVGSDFAINMTGSVRMNNDLGVTGSLTVDGTTTINNDVNVTGILTVTGETRFQSNLYVSGNLEVLGSSTNVNIQSSTVEIGDNIILVNAYSPFQQYAGLAAYDSGSVGTSGSLLWDSLNDYWMFVSSSGQSSKFIGTTAGTYGSENSLTLGTFPIASGNNTIGDSLLTYSGTTLAFNTNKFTIDSGTGDTMVSGNFTLSYSGGTDNGSKTSGIMFRNSSNVVGFVSTTETTDVLDGILGYKQSDGGLTFSTVIDGGTY